MFILLTTTVKKKTSFERLEEKKKNFDLLVGGVVLLANIQLPHPHPTRTPNTR